MDCFGCISSNSIRNLRQIQSKVGIVLTIFIVLIYIKFISSINSSGKMAEWSKAQR